jgi:putative flippase GtrA
MQGALLHMQLPSVRHLGGSISGSCLGVFLTYGCLGVMQGVLLHMQLASLSTLVSQFLGYVLLFIISLVSCCSFSF